MKISSWSNFPVSSLQKAEKPACLLYLSTQHYRDHSAECWWYGGHLALKDCGIEKWTWKKLPCTYSFNSSPDNLQFVFWSYTYYSSRAKSSSGSVLDIRAGSLQSCSNTSALFFLFVFFWETNGHKNDLQMVWFNVTNTWFCAFYFFPPNYCLNTLMWIAHSSLISVGMTKWAILFLDFSNATCSANTHPCLGSCNNNERNCSLFR